MQRRVQLALLQTRLCSSVWFAMFAVCIAWLTPNPTFCHLFCSPFCTRSDTILQARLVFATAETSPFDVAVLELQDSVPSFQPPDLATTFQPGEYQLQAGVDGTQWDSMGEWGRDSGILWGQWGPM